MMVLFPSKRGRTCIHNALRHCLKAFGVDSYKNKWCTNLCCNIWMEESASVWPTSVTRWQEIVCINRQTITNEMEDYPGHWIINKTNCGSLSPHPITHSDTFILCRTCIVTQETNFSMNYQSPQKLIQSSLSHP